MNHLCFYVSSLKTHPTNAAVYVFQFNFTELCIYASVGYAIIVSFKDLSTVQRKVIISTKFVLWLIEPLEIWTKIRRFSYKKIMQKHPWNRLENGGHFSCLNVLKFHAMWISVKSWPRRLNDGRDGLDFYMPNCFEETWKYIRSFPEIPLNNIICRHYMLRIVAK